MMDFKEFQNQILQEAKDRMWGVDLSIQNVEKLQGQSYTGMTIQPNDSPVAATVNLDVLYGQMMEGKPFEAIVDNLVEQAAEIVVDMPKFDVTQLNDYDKMKNTLVVQVIPTDRNQEMLANIPHKDIEDMSVVYRMQLDANEKGTSSVLMTNAMIENYGITPEQLHQDAMEATVINNPATFRSMADVMRDLMGPEMFDLMPPIDMGGPQMYVASVEGGVNGAGVIAYPDFMGRVADEMGGDFFVLPSSVHEVLVIPDDGTMVRQELENMVREVNSTEVLPQDQLSDNVYHYDSQDKVFELAASYEDRMAVKEQAMEYGSGAEPAKDTINVLLVEPNCYPKEVEIGTGLEDLQKAVGGNIEVSYPFEDNVGLVMNEEGKIEGLPLNRAIRDENGQITDVVAGSFLVVGLTEDSFGSLSPDQMKTFEDTFHQPEAFVKMGKGIMAVPIPDNVVKEMEKHREKPPKEKAKPSKSQDVLS
ncbi:MAG: DUF5688 family protein [Lachnospiraceae bacterium]|nr:DUF5688 family protein [Lachnospiraceae bacterium]